MKEKKKLIEVLFKSGATVRFHCSNFSAKTLSGELTGYNCDGIPVDEQVLFLNIPDIDSIRVVPEK